MMPSLAVLALTVRPIGPTAGQAGAMATARAPAFGFVRPLTESSPRQAMARWSPFFARNASGVRDFHAAALAHGGSDEGAPGTRPYYDPTFYVAYVRDSDGNKLACAFLDYRQE
jgi:hypothetical protein